MDQFLVELHDPEANFVLHINMDRVLVEPRDPEVVLFINMDQLLVELQPLLRPQGVGLNRKIAPMDDTLKISRWMVEDGCCR